MGDKRDKYDNKMLELGFRKIHPWVHDDDRDEVLEIIKKKREKKLKQLDKSR